MEQHGDWVSIYISDQPHKIEIVKAFLDDNRIPTVSVNKKDSAYITIGDIELFCRTEDAVLASFLIKENQL